MQSISGVRGARPLLVSESVGGELPMPDISCVQIQVHMHSTGMILIEMGSDLHSSVDYQWLLRFLFWLPFPSQTVSYQLSPLHLKTTAC